MLYFEFESVLKFYNRDASARVLKIVALSINSYNRLTEIESAVFRLCK